MPLDEIDFLLADFKVNRCTRRCHLQSRPLRDGEWYFSVVIEHGDDLIRRDYSAEAWTGPPEGTVGWWKGRMPLAGTRKLVLAPDPVLIDLLRGLGGSVQRQPLRYLLALMLLRRRVVSTISEIENNPMLPAKPAASKKTESGEPEPMRLRVNADGTEIEVMPCTISRRQTEELEVALQELLYCEAPE